MPGSSAEIVSVFALSFSSIFGQPKRPSSSGDMLVVPKPRNTSSKRRFISRCKVRNGSKVSPAGASSRFFVQGLCFRIVMLFSFTHELRCGRRHAPAPVLDHDRVSGCFFLLDLRGGGATRADLDATRLHRFRN